MKSQHRANNYVLLASLIWGLVLSLASWGSGWFLTGDPGSILLWRGGNFLALILYPLLVCVVLHRKTHLWINAFLYSAVGSMLVSIGIYALRSFLSGYWLGLGVGILILGVMVQGFIPRFEQVPALQKEWKSPLWGKLNASSFMEFLLLQFHLPDDLAG